MACSKDSRGRAVFECYLCEVESSLLSYASRFMSERLKLICDPLDVVQGAYAEAWDKKDRFRGRSPGEFLSWLKRFVRLEVRNRARSAGYLKRDQRRLDPTYQGDLVRLEELPAREPEPPEVLRATERVERINAALMELTRRQLSIITLVFFERKTVQTAGELLGIERSAAYKCLERGMKRLEAVLGPSFRDEVERR